VDGVETRICANDATHTETRPIPATGHVWGEWTVTTPATCLVDGVETRICANDATHVETRAIPATGHTAGEQVIIEEPTCTTVGVWEIRCTICEELLDSGEIELLEECDDPDCPICNPVGGGPITYIQIINENGDPIFPQQTVSRNSTVQFSVQLNPGASPTGLIWATSNATFATVDNTGLVTFRNFPGSVSLIVTDPVSGIRHTVTLRIV